MGTFTFLDSRIVWLPTDWLISIVLERPIVEPNMTGHVCAHRGLGNVRGLKAVDGVTADELCNKLKVFPKPISLTG